MPISPTLDDFSADFTGFLDRLGFDDVVTTLGLVPHAADGESLSLRLPLRDTIAQASGMFSAAALFGAADIVGTFVAMQSYADSGKFPLAVQSNQNFLGNSRAEYAVARGSLLQAGGNVAVAEVEIDDAAGKRLMRATFTYMLSERRVGR